MTFTLQKQKTMNLVFGVSMILSSLFLGSINIFHFVNDLILCKEKEITIYKNFHCIIDEIPEMERDSICN